MSSTQRSVARLTGAVGTAAAITASDAFYIPVGASIGGAQITVTLDAGGAFNLGSVGGKLQATNEALVEGGMTVSPTANWKDVPGGVLPVAAVVQSGLVGDGNNQIDVSAYLFVRVLPTVDTGLGTPEDLTVTANLKFDYTRG